MSRTYFKLYIKYGLESKKSELTFLKKMARDPPLAGF